MQRAVAVLIVAATVLLTGGVAGAQRSDSRTGVLQGRVRSTSLCGAQPADGSECPTTYLPGFTVSAAMARLGITSTTTDESGGYALRLRPGRYTVRADGGTDWRCPRATLVVVRPGIQSLELVCMPREQPV